MKHHLKYIYWSSAYLNETPKCKINIPVNSVSIGLSGNVESVTGKHILFNFKEFSKRLHKNFLMITSPCLHPVLLVLCRGGEIL
jgi:hypothetical protein